MTLPNTHKYRHRAILGACTLLLPALALMLAREVCAPAPRDAQPKAALEPTVAPAQPSISKKLRRRSAVRR